MNSVQRKQRQMQEFAHATARVLIASYFIAAGGGVIVDPNSMGRFLSLSAVPGYLIWPNAAFQIVAALAILVGFQTRLASALLALYLFWSSFILNYVPGDPLALGAFWRDLAMIGGLLMLFSHGRGCYALDNFLLKQTEKHRLAERAASEIAIQTAAIDLTPPTA